MSAPRKRCSKGRNQGAGSRQPIARVISRERFDADAHGEIHLVLAEHKPKPGHERGRTFLHLHAHAQGGRKPAALNHPQLVSLIRRLQGILDSISTSPAPAPVVEVTHTSTKHRVRRRPGTCSGGADPAADNGGVA